MSEYTRCRSHFPNFITRANYCRNFVQTQFRSALKLHRSYPPFRALSPQCHTAFLSTMTVDEIMLNGAMKELRSELQKYQEQQELRLCKAQEASETRLLRAQEASEARLTAAQAAAEARSIASELRLSATQAAADARLTATQAAAEARSTAAEARLTKAQAAAEARLEKSLSGFRTGIILSIWGGLVTGLVGLAGLAASYSTISSWMGGYWKWEETTAKVDESHSD